VYRSDTAIFAAHDHCNCTAVPVFGPGDVGEEAGVMQYLGSRRHKTAADRQRLNDYLDAMYPRIDAA